MDGFGGGSRILDSPKLQCLGQLGAKSTGDAVFDASQYAFFGGDAVEEVDLGGLEDEEDDIVHSEYDDEELRMEKEEEETFESLSEVDDLSSAFSKLNNIVSRTGNPEVYNIWGSRESSSAANLVPDADFTSWMDQRAFDAEYNSESRKLSQPYPALAHTLESNTLHRTSFLEQQQLLNQQKLPHQYTSEPTFAPRSSFMSYPPRDGISLQASPNQQPMTLPDMSPFSNSQLQLNSLPQSQLARNVPQLPQGFNQNQCRGQFRGNTPVLPNNFMPPMMPQHNGLLRPQVRPPQFSQLMRPPQQQSSFRPFSVLPPTFGPSISSRNFDNLGLQEMGSQRIMPVPASKQMSHFPHHVADSGFQRGDSGYSRFRSKYMTSGEIENIIRMQLVATHSSDPYVEDYYHQACLARKSSGASLRHHFCPTTLRDGSSKSRAIDEPHAFLQVDALGRVAFSSIRRPRPLLEVDAADSSDTISGESLVSQKPLDQEPMLAARAAIEDGMSLLLDVDDIDRFIQFSRLPDGGAELRQRRLLFLEELASCLSLADPLMKNGQQVNLSPNDDLVFLRIASLPKGRKLLLRFLKLLEPGELTRVVCMAVFRNLRFLFGSLPADPGASLTTIATAKAVSSCIQKMDLKALSCCLASMVCSRDQPPLRPTGSLSGGASVIVKSVLERATELLTDPETRGNCTPPVRSFWQASFDAFFGLLMKCCLNNYDTVAQTFLVQGKELPVELLRASLPHTSEQQRKILLEFSQRSMPVSGGETPPL